MREYRQDLPPQLRDRISEFDTLGWNGAGLSYQFDLSVAPGTKAGGWPNWHAMDPFAMRCDDCDDQLELLVCFDTTERDDGIGQWNAARPGLEKAEDLGNVTGLVPGRGGDLQIFCCPTDPTHQPFILVQG
ncbi:hypothetical protein ACNQVK_24695 [Mycobacterium sp. 134]|uniref:hypothetical protein n=1 Tax=Mycobacterium sp. 134 TaxID=3400425 RepID=UPI003AB005E9